MFQNNERYFYRQINNNEKLENRMQQNRNTYEAVYRNECSKRITIAEWLINLKLQWNKTEKEFKIMTYSIVKY